MYRRGEARRTAIVAAGTERIGNAVGRDDGGGEPVSQLGRVRPWVIFACICSNRREKETDSSGAEMAVALQGAPFASAEVHCGLCNVLFDGLTAMALT
mmetsp:Transcript_10296/g.30367  ORF Transcript_10296/g.30367 Transcript_10296/m.30367 type:complete len:98 (+) Transcript_10296:184-477(+)